MKRASCWFIVLWSVWLCHAFNADFCRAVVGMTTTPASRCRTWQNKQRWLPPLVTLTFEYIFACFFFRLSWIRAKPVVSRRLWSYVYHCMQFVLVTTRSVKKYWRVHVAVNEEQLVLGCFDHKGVHHAATETAHQHFFMLLLLFIHFPIMLPIYCWASLSRILLDMDAQEVLKRQSW